MARVPVALLQKPLEQLKNALLLFQRTEQFPHALAGEVKIQPDQVVGAFEMDLRHQAQIQQALAVQQTDTLQNGVIGRAFQFQAALQLAMNAGQRQPLKL